MLTPNTRPRGAPIAGRFDGTGRGAIGAVAVAVALALGAPALGQTGTGEGRLGGPHRSEPTGGAAGARDAAMGRQQPLTRADIAFVKQAAENNHAEVDSAKVALQKASDPQVKAFAQQMIDDHGKAGSQLTALAAAKNVDLPNGPSTIQKAKLKVLEAFDGADFDRRYTKTMAVDAHRETVELFEKGAREARDPAIRTFATETLPTLRHHLERAMRLPDAREGARDIGARTR